MSNSKSTRVLIIGTVEPKTALSESVLFQEAQELSLHDNLEWLFFYYDNMGIITDVYNNHLITGYPVLEEVSGGEPFSCSVSRTLFREFFERFLFAKKISVVITSTQIALEQILNITQKKRMRVYLFDPNGILEKKCNTTRTLRKALIIPSPDNTKTSIKNMPGTQSLTLKDLLQEVLKQLS